MENAAINLVQLVSAVRSQLESTEREMRSAGKAPLFDLEGFELEIKFTVSENDTQKGGFDIKVVNLGSQSDVKAEEVQSIKIKYSVSRRALSTGVLGSRAHSTTIDAGAEKKDIKPLP
jgi:Trypsin-co-occurring domain 2